MKFYLFRHHASLENAKKAVIELHKDYLDFIKGKDINQVKTNPEFISKATSLAIAYFFFFYQK